MEERLEFYKTGKAPRKNIDVMQEAVKASALLQDNEDEEMGGAAAAAEPTKDAKKSKKKKKDKKRAAEEPAATEGTVTFFFFFLSSLFLFVLMFVCERERACVCARGSIVSSFFTCAFTPHPYSPNKI